MKVRTSSNNVLKDVLKYMLTRAQARARHKRIQGNAKFILQARIAFDTVVCISKESFLQKTLLRKFKNIFVVVQIRLQRMCGSLLSKFRKSSNRVDPAIIIFPDPGQDKSKTKLADKDAACYEDREFWKDDDRKGESSIHSFMTISSESFDSSASDSSSQSEIEAAVRALDRPVLHSTSGKKVRLSVVESYINQERILLESAREILACQGYSVSSNSNTITAQPLSSSNSNPLGKVKTAVAFDIPVCNEKTVCPSARVPWHLRKRGKVAPELTLQEVREKMRAAEERKLKELERIRESARSRAGVIRPHPAELSAQATKEKIAAKQAAAERKRHDEMEKRKEAGNRASRSRDRIAAARAFAKAQLETPNEREMEEPAGRKAKKQQKADKQKRLLEKHVEMNKNKVYSFQF